MTYDPKPIDTSHVSLNASLQKLTELIAKDVHDRWAKQRMADGWVFGPQRSDPLKTTPCMIPYENLPESEKNYDRILATEVLKAILALGYSIREPSDCVIGIEGVQVVRETLKKPLTLGELLRVWTTQQTLDWENHPEIYLELGKKFLDVGEFFHAFDILSRGREVVSRKMTLPGGEAFCPLLKDLVHGQCLALTQCGALEEALRLLREYLKTGIVDGEINGLLGRFSKEMALAASNPGDRQRWLDDAIGLYGEGFELARSEERWADTYYNGINVATLHMMAGREKRSCEVAEIVVEIAGKELASEKAEKRKPSPWLRATLGEGALLVGRLEEARYWYREAADLLKHDWRSLSSMRNQALRLQEFCRFGTAVVRDFFPAIGVGFCIADEFPQGEPGSASIGFLQDGMTEWILEHGIRIGYVSLRSHLEFLFAEEILRLGWELQIVLPYSVDLFRELSILPVFGEAGVERFDRLIAKAGQVRVVGNDDPHDGLGRFADLLVLGHAIARGKTLGIKSHGFFGVVSGSNTIEPEEPSSRAHQLWLEWRPRCSVTQTPSCGGLKIAGYCIVSGSIDETRFSGGGRTGRSTELLKGPSFPLPEGGYFHVFKPILFADCKGYSTLNEREILRFSHTFLGLVGTIVERYEKGILQKRTAGDGLFLIFHDIETAAAFALDLRNGIEEMRWEEHALPKNLRMRISLDVGPCYSYDDPVTKRMDFCGAYVNRAARMEPVTPPGHIYASETFVAMAHALQVASFLFSYAGRVTLPKNYGLIQVYHLDKRLQESA